MGVTEGEGEGETNQAPWLTALDVSTVFGAPAADALKTVLDICKRSLQIQLYHRKVVFVNRYKPVPVSGYFARYPKQRLLPGASAYVASLFVRYSKP